MKSTLRKELIFLRKNIKNKSEKSRQIAKNLLSQPFLADAKTVMVYLSYNDEVDTFGLIEELLLKNIRLCAPVCQKDGTMVAKEFHHLSDLKPGAFGILEPQGVTTTDIDLVIVPGVGFNDNFHRIGYGKGYYDRFLDGFFGITCGLFYDEQKADFCQEPHDLPLDYIITQTKILKRA